MEQSAAPMACPDCHALTEDLAAHEQWHTRLVRDIAVAVTQHDAAKGTSTTG